MFSVMIELFKKIMISPNLVAIVAFFQLPRTLHNLSCFALDLIFDLKWMLCGFALLLGDFCGVSNAVCRANKI